MRKTPSKASQATLLGTALVALLLAGLAAALPGQSAGGEAGGTAQWIWSNPADPAPKNRFTYFRKVVEITTLPEDATLRFAADSNAHVWINGHIVRRKVARYHEERITAELINAAPYLHAGKNVIVVLHHNWGPITTFQRTGNKHAGLFLDSAWVRSNASWRWVTAPQFLAHEKQLVGVIKHPRIRYSQIIDGRKRIPGDIHSPDFNDSIWKPAVVVRDGPWPPQPADVETPGQREHPVSPLAVVAAGTIERAQPLSDDPFSMARGIRTATYHPDPRATQEAQKAIRNQPVVLEGKAGESRYITFDFYRPVHGYPYLRLAEASAGVLMDLGYGEISYAQYDGEMHVREDGWINPEGVIGDGYADRYITAPGAQRVEIPDERTARWLALHVHFPSAGRVVIEDLGFVKSQYPIEPTGSFMSGNERIDQIIKLCLIHAEVSMNDAYVDTTGREDGQWIEDARLRADIGARWFGDNRLREFMIRTIAQSQGPDGDFHPFPPANFPAYPAAYDWSVQWVAILYDEYMWSGSTRYIERYWENLRRYWANVLSHLGDDGIWRTRRVLADLRVGLHAETDQQSSGIVTPWIIERLRWSAQMAEAIGESGQAGTWRQAAQRMAEAFRAHHLVKAAGGVPAHVADRLDTANPSLARGYSQAGQTVAVTAGLLTPAEARADLNYAFPDPDGSPPSGVTRWNNPTYSYRSLRALSDTGLTRRAVAHLIERYEPYLPGHPRNRVPLKLQGPYGGPLPEYWVNRDDRGLKPGEPNTPHPEDETGSHGWGAVPLMWLHDSLLGVRLLEPGGAKIRIAPEDGGLPYVSGHTNTPNGLVWVYWDPQQWTLHTSIPEGVNAEVLLPAACDGKRIRIVEAAGQAEPQTGRTYQIRGAGKYIFQVN